jgi:hypothetical protein
LGRRNVNIGHAITSITTSRGHGLINIRHISFAHITATSTINIGLIFISGATSTSLSLSNIRLIGALRGDDLLLVVEVVFFLLLEALLGFFLVGFFLVDEVRGIAPSGKGFRLERAFLYSFNPCLACLIAVVSF